jgi:hypothetical protein
MESELLYYVYALIDPRNNLPFYIGKGKDNRALSDFSENSLKKDGNTRKTAKIKKLNSLGFTPMIEFYAQNIEDEILAYDIENFYIKKYGRIGYEENGILTNMCEDNRPPNHKNKSYKEIYGVNSEKERLKRYNKQLYVGGFFKGRKHSAESKEKISSKTKGKNNPRFGVIVKNTDVARKISESNKGKKHYNAKNVKILYIEGLNIILYSNDLKIFCKQCGYTYSTFRSQLEKGWSKSKSGKNKGLLIRHATPEEINDKEREIWYEI